MKLIFIEGVPGVGKSTSTKKLCDKLINAGYTASCFLEGEQNNPIDLYWYAYLTKADYDKLIISNNDFSLSNDTFYCIREKDYVLVRYKDFDKHYFTPELYNYFKKREVCYKAENPVPFDIFTQIFINRWHAFLSGAIINYDFIIFDGAFLAHQINDMMRNYKPDDTSVIAHIKTILQIVSPYNPVVFYLESQDIWERIRAANISRGQSIPPKEQTAFWNNRKRLDLLALDELQVKSYRFDITDGNWNESVDRMFGILLDTGKRAFLKKS